MIKAFNLVLSKEQIASRSLVDSIFGIHDFLKIDPKWVFSFLEIKSNWHPPKKKCNECGYIAHEKFKKLVIVKYIACPLNTNK